MCTESVTQHVTRPLHVPSSCDVTQVFKFHGTVQEAKELQQRMWREWREQAVSPVKWTPCTVYGTKRTASWECHTNNPPTVGTDEKVEHSRYRTEGMYELYPTQPIKNPCNLGAR